MLFAIYVGAVETAKVAQTSLRRIHFEDEVMARDLGVIRDADVTIRHAAEDEGIVLLEGERLSIVPAFGDFQ